MSTPVRRQRVAAYAVIVRDGAVLLSRLAPRLTSNELWTLPGGGLDHGENPRDAVVREVHEETGLSVTIGEQARVYSLHTPSAWRDGTLVDAHALRIVYEGWVPKDSPPPRVVEVDGSTVEAAWIPLEKILDGTRPVVSLVSEALRDHFIAKHQRLAAYAVIRRDHPEPAVLLTRISPRGHHAGWWTLPGGGVDHGEPPAEALAREVEEECGVPARVGALIDVHDVHFIGTAPSGRTEDFHGIHLLFTGQVDADAPLRVTEVDGTTDAVQWVSLAEITDGSVPVLDVVKHALAAG